jgi:hypothetical protein
MILKRLFCVESFYCSTTHDNEELLTSFKYGLSMVIVGIFTVKLCREFECIQSIILKYLLVENQHCGYSS